MSIFFAQKQILTNVITYGILILLVLTFIVAPLGGVENLSAAPTTAEQLNAEHNPDKDACWQGFGGLSIGNCMMWAFAYVGYMLLWLVSFVLWVAGTVLNFSIDQTVIEMSANINDIEGINNAWVVLRDLANMFFIFILLYAAMSLILRLNINAQRVIVHVVVIALLINFSMFFTKVVIDASNFVAIGFYGAFQQTALAGGELGGISGAFMEGLGLTTLWALGESAQEMVDVTGGNLGSLFVLAIVGSILMLVASFVFLAGAFFFVVRFVMLIFLMILSPLAFAAMALPQTQGQARSWWKQLSHQAIFAPAFLALLWVAIVVLNGLEIGGGTGTTIVEAVQGDGSGAPADGAVDLFFNFAIVIGFVVGALILAKTLGIQAGAGAVSMGANLARRGAGFAYGGAALAGQKTVGKAGQRIARSERLKDAQSAGGVSGTLAGAFRGVGDKAAQSSFDVRATRLAGKEYGKARKGGYRATEEAKVKKTKEVAKSLQVSPEKKEEARLNLEKAVESGDQASIEKAQQEIDRIEGVSEKEARKRVKKKEEQSRISLDAVNRAEQEGHDLKSDAGAQRVKEIHKEIEEKRVKDLEQESASQQRQEEYRKSLTEIPRWWWPTTNKYPFINKVRGERLRQANAIRTEGSKSKEEAQIEGLQEALKKASGKDKDDE